MATVTPTEILLRKSHNEESQSIALMQLSYTLVFNLQWKHVIPTIGSFWSQMANIELGPLLYAYSFSALNKENDGVRRIAHAKDFARAVVQN